MVLSCFLAVLLDFFANQSYDNFIIWLAVLREVFDNFDTGLSIDEILLSIVCRNR